MNRLSCYSYGEDTPYGRGGATHRVNIHYNQMPFFGPVRSGAFLRPIPGHRPEGRKTTPQNGPEDPAFYPALSRAFQRHFCWVCWVKKTGGPRSPVGP